MMFIVLSLALSAHAQSYSRLLPYFQEAIRERAHLSVPAQEIRHVLMKKRWVSRNFQSALVLPPLVLPPAVKQVSSTLPWMPIALQITQFDVLEASDDWFKDDIYCYFIVTNGVLPHAKVSQIYRGLNNGESFHFDLNDRSLFPLNSTETQGPRGTLVIDYGIVESDGDDIQELHQLSELITELAVAVYQVLDPVEAAQWGSLRQEVVALTRALTSLNHDDRLVTGTLVLTAEEAHRLLAGGNMATIKRKHQNNHFFDKWRYRLVWRLLKD